MFLFWCIFQNTKFHYRPHQGNVWVSTVLLLITSTVRCRAHVSITRNTPLTSLPFRLGLGALVLAACPVICRRGLWK